MNCRRTLKKINPYLSDALNAEEIRKLQSHLSSCRRCNGEFEYLKSINNMIGNIDFEEEPEGMWNAIRNEIMIEQKHSKRLSLSDALSNLDIYFASFSFRKRVAAAFGVLAFILLLAGGFLYWNQTRSLSTSGGGEYMEEYMEASMNDPLSDRIALNFIIAKAEEQK
ncbi:MAG: zf-HC2 domain-containing protein [Candidatus Schekmanbacteria bacterium]|nr:zf-HC2 domain-containing protein [Candidatus Schekmanbacteria bacterium]